MRMFHSRPVTGTHRPNQRMIDTVARGHMMIVEDTVTMNIVRKGGKLGLIGFIFFCIAQSHSSLCLL